MKNRWLAAGVGCVIVIAIAARGNSKRSEAAPDSPRTLAEFEVPAIFSDGMVLQRGLRAPIWGRAVAREHVLVELFDNAGVKLCRAEAIADGAGDWRVELANLTAGGPDRLEIRGDAGAKRALTINDVQVGEVWLGSGQSNMRMTAVACDGFKQARARADLPCVRVFLEESPASPVRQWHCSGRWVCCSPKTCADFSGVLFWFGLELHDQLDVPIGLIDVSVGGSRIELWTSAEPQFASPEIAPYASERDADYWSFDQDAILQAFEKEYTEWQARADEASKRGETAPKPPRNRTEGRLRLGTIGYLFNGKIAPLATYGLRGILWYQGEDNVRFASNYGAQLELLVADWRAHWGRADLPFCWVQLPNFADGRKEADWPRMREEMRRTLCVANTGMVVAIDVGLSIDLHPTNKAALGHRLGGWALDEVYGIPRAWSSPLFAGHVVEGSRVTVSFAPTYGALAPVDRDLPYFELAGRDGLWHEARARVSERDAQCVIVESDEVAEPIDVRYAWSDDPAVELVNSANLPAGPFTTRL